jgi:hypothetical protein
MSAAERLSASVKRWHTLGAHAKNMTAAGMFGAMVGRSFSTDAVSMDGLAAMLEDNVERAAREEAQELERTARLATEADE